jgi:hypothetical protein
MRSDVVLFGTGNLARSIVYNLATTMSPTPLSVLVVGRSRVDADEIAFVARGRAGAVGESHRVQPLAANWADASVAGDILHQHRPVVTIVAASEQSPWELADDADPWARLVKRGGYGVTLPLNASLVSRVFRAASETEPRPLFVNACYADAVNGLLGALGPRDRLLGAGNAAIIESLHRGASPEKPSASSHIIDTLESCRLATSGIHRWSTRAAAAHRSRGRPLRLAGYVARS